MKYYKRTIEKSLERLSKMFDEFKQSESSQTAQRLLKQFEGVYSLIDSSQLSNSAIQAHFDIKNKYDEISSMEHSALVGELKGNLKNFKSWSLIMKKELKYKIVVLGTNDYTVALLDVLDFEKVQIEAIIDETNKFLEHDLNGYEIQSLMILGDLAVDYILIVSTDIEGLRELLNQTAYKNRVINYIGYVEATNLSPEYTIKLMDLVQKDLRHTEGVLTGLSYVQKGVNENVLQKPFVNLANPSQDLFYDFLMFKYFYENHLDKNKVNYSIIGLSYYSLHYDLSLSKENMSRTNYYYALLKNFHNAPYRKEYQAIHDEIDSADIFKKYHYLESFRPWKEHFNEIIEEGHKNVFDLDSISDKNLLENIQVAKRNYAKDYTSTVQENKLILKEYIQYLTERNIKPIILVCPATKLYQAFTPERFKVELYEYFEDLKLEGFEFRVLDYYDSSEFNNSHFYDSSHMNMDGAYHLAQILNRDLDW